MKIHAMWQDYPALAPDLTATLDLIDQNIHPDNPAVAKALVQMINAGGKLLRPAYCLLFSQFHETDHEKIIALAAAVETLHTATLIHDDVIDKAPVRRGTKTIAAQFGNDVAVYAGDYLFVVCFQLIAHYASDLRSVQQDSASMERILNGEMAQMARRFNVDMTIADYTEQVTGKTGQLFALAAFIGAYESGQSLHFAKKCEAIGLNIGIAFQLMDDILDYTSTDAAMGKPVHEDIRQGVYSAPLIMAMADHQAEFAPLLNKRAAMTDADVTSVLDLITRYDGVSKAQALAAQYTDKAVAGLTSLPDQPARATLIRLTKQLLTRQS
ncbi:MULTISPECIES: polyprenyl synthetase family protein [unclassified Lacticaseibacillus]|uniref:polyprenyl synthetase family protein n=1 Tax=unclassified Lacticaseibacillus TaxID=2759744 RepID=UPI001943567C|nr:MULTISPECIES: polyprenyl synthetase family protein [unclassified Lacticaseibacillus]